MDKTESSTVVAENRSKDFWGFPVTHFSYFFTWVIVF